MLTAQKPENDSIRISVSQIKKYERCKRAYWFEYGAPQRKSPPSKAAQLGTDVHTVLENYLDGQEIPETRAGRIASSGLHHLPDPSSVTLEKNILIPIGDEGARMLCRIDMMGTDIAYIGDHKTTSDFRWAKSVYEVHNDVQLLTYAYAAYHEDAPEEVQVELIYYRTRGLPLSMKVQATIDWPTIEANWKRLADTVPALQQIRANKTGEGILGNSAACGDYGGCFHCSVCPFSPEGLAKVSNADKIVAEAGPHETTKTTKESPKMKKTQSKNLQNAMGISRILPSQPQEEVEQTTALLHDAATKIRSYLVEFNRPISKAAVENLLNKLGVAVSKLDSVLAMAGAVMDEFAEVQLKVGPASSADLMEHALQERCEAYDKEDGPATFQHLGDTAPCGDAPEEGKIYALTSAEGKSIANGDSWEASEVKETVSKPQFEKVNIDTLKELSAELTDVFGEEGGLEQDALDYCQRRVVKTKKISARRWAKIVEFSVYTLDGGWLVHEKTRNPEGYTEDPDGDNDALPVCFVGEGKTKIEEIRSVSQSVKEKERIEVPALPRRKRVSETSEPSAPRGSFTTDVPCEECEGIGCYKCSHKIATQTVENFTQDCPECGAESNGTSGDANGCDFCGFRALAGSFVILVDVVFERTPPMVMTLADYLEPYQQMVAEQNGVDYYDLVEFYLGRRQVAAKVLADCHETTPVGVLLVDSRDPMSGEILPILRRCTGATVLRALR